MTSKDKVEFERKYAYVDNSEWQKMIVYIENIGIYVYVEEYEEVDTFSDRHNGLN